MKLLFLYGMPGVGKLTIARELAELTHFKLFHNHLTVDLVLSLFEFGSPPFVEAREKIWMEMFSQATRSDLEGMIFSFVPERTVSDKFVPGLVRLVEEDGGEISFVELTCSRDELEKRITNDSRSKFGKLTSLEMFRDLQAAGVFEAPLMPPSDVTLDVTSIPPKEAAARIAERLGLKTSVSDVVKQEGSIQDAYSEWAASYDEDGNRTRDLDEAVTRQLLRGKSFSSVLEIGCGTGKNTALLAQISEMVLALDFSEKMLAIAQDKLSGVDNVKFQVTDLNRPWPCADRSVDMVSCNLVLEHIEDLNFIFREAARCLRRGGEFLVSELHPFRQYQGTKARFERQEQTTYIDAFLHHVSDFMKAGKEAGLRLERYDEWWHEEDEGKPPRLVTLEFVQLGEW